MKRKDKVRNLRKYGSPPMFISEHFLSESAHFELQLNSTKKPGSLRTWLNLPFVRRRVTAD
jgi:hypothetical protein